VDVSQRSTVLVNRRTTVGVGRTRHVLVRRDRDLRGELSQNESYWSFAQHLLLCQHNTFHVSGIPKTWKTTAIVE